MKKFIKGRWFPLMIAVAAEAILLIFLYCNNFRITYAPDLENSWDAVSAFAAWAGVVSSFIAIMVAIQIPKKIADRQDKIALFKERYTVYSEICKIYSICNSLNALDGLEKKYVLIAVGKMYDVELDNENYLNNYLTIFSAAKNTELIIKQLPFLFSDISKSDVGKLSAGLANYISYLAGKEMDEAHNSNDLTVQSFIETYNNFIEKYSDIMNEQLYLGMEK